jgi:hypothetical protein
LFSVFFCFLLILIELWHNTAVKLPWWYLAQVASSWQHGKKWGNLGIPLMNCSVYVCCEWSKQIIILFFDISLSISISISLYFYLSLSLSLSQDSKFSFTMIWLLVDSKFVSVIS